MEPNEIKAHLILKQITLSSIAKKLGVTRGAVSQVIHNIHSNPRIRKAIADALEKPVNEIWPERENQSKKR